MSVAHISFLHVKGSTNPSALSALVEGTRFYPKFLVKDIFGFFGIVGPLALFTVFLFPNVLGHPDNYIKADALVTPAHIVPE